MSLFVRSMTVVTAMEVVSDDRSTSLAFLGSRMLEITKGIIVGIINTVGDQVANIFDSSDDDGNVGMHAQSVANGG